MAEYGKPLASTRRYRRRSGYSQSELDLICKKFPELTVLPEPSVDDLVQIFLAKHDVFSSPPGSKGVAYNMFIGAMTGYTGVVGGGILKMEKNQRDIAARQEWTSWKQWAISHVDWQSFKAQAEVDIEEKRKAALSLWETDEMLARVSSYIHENKMKKLLSKLYFLIAIVVSFTIVFPALKVLDGLTVPPRKDANPSGSSFYNK